MSVGLSVCMSYHKYHFCKEPNVVAKIIQFISTKSLNELETNHEKPASSMATTMMETTHGPTSSMITVMGATTWQQRPCKCFHWLMPSTHVLRLAHNVTHSCTIIVRVRAMVYTLSYNCTNDPVSEATKSIQNELYSSSNYGWLGVALFQKWISTDDFTMSSAVGRFESHPRKPHISQAPTFVIITAVTAVTRINHSSDKGPSQLRLQWWWSIIALWRGSITAVTAVTRVNHSCDCSDKD